METTSSWVPATDVRRKVSDHLEAAAQRVNLFITTLQPESLVSAVNYIAIAICLTVIFAPALAFAQTIDPTTAVTAMETWFTGPFAKILISFMLCLTGVACIIGHHPFAGVGLVVLGAFLIFGSQFFVTQFFGG